VRNANPIRAKTFRCAIYTRKSSEEGLEQDFNSLHAQRESCDAYIKSQRHEGWIPLPALYDDGGYSGGSTDRPALKRLLADIQSHLIDVVVVYKVDRLTRSLADFAKIVEIFDAAGVSFVSVTQQFNTTTSMGRLTLNVLLSFAQFEREVTGERIRDKIAASKEKGMWMGGWVPLGYDRKDRTLTINETEARTVQSIFHLFLEFKNVQRVQTELARLHLRTKPYATPRGRAIGGLPFARGHIYRILSNPLYIGEIEHKGVRHPGLHPPVISRTIWDEVQAQLAANRHNSRARTNAKSTSLLAGLLYDEAGNRLVSSHAAKNGKRYRYYITSGGTGRPGMSAITSKLRLPAAKIDELLLTTLCTSLRDRADLSQLLREHGLEPAQIAEALETAASTADLLSTNSRLAERDLVEALVEKAVVANSRLQIEISRSHLLARLLPNSVDLNGGDGASCLLTVELPALDRKESTTILIKDQNASEPDTIIIKAIARASAWMEELTTGRSQSMAEIAARENITDNYVSNLIHLAWLSPDMVEQVLAGDTMATTSARNVMHTRKVNTFWKRQND
jgi:DNA invertase Pin-like site-specific DNA recombinase